MSSRAEFNGVVIAGPTSNTQVVEGNVYFPLDSVKKEYLKDSATLSTCPWKGEAHYYTVNVNGQEAKDAGWFYPAPKPAASAIKDHVAFWNGVKVVSA
ncbi:hypothetical protein HK101_004132 [Irineochytrium annulatum]|nr:hypothetical protein HK101_004132 [Irineochytrium annulatum]